MATSIQITALDGIVNVNSLFTLAVFIGLSWNPTDYQTNTLIQDPTCLPPSHVASSLVSYQIYAFSSFLFSSLVALALKQAIRIPNFPHLRLNPDIFGHVRRDLLRVGMLVSGLGSVCGSVFLMLALVNVAQTKLGAFGCRSSAHTVAAVVPLVVFVPLALLLYVCVVLYAFTR